MSIHQSTLRVRIGRNLILELNRWIADPAKRFTESYWTASLRRKAVGGSQTLVFVAGGQGKPEIDEDAHELTVWVGLANFRVPSAERARIEEWIAANEQPNAREGADRTVSAGASHAGRDSAAGKPGDVNGAQQRTPPIEEGPRDLLRAGGSAAPPAGMQGSPLPVATAGVAS